MKYKDNLTESEQAALIAEIQRLDQCYADSDASAPVLEPGQDPDELDESFDPIRDGWVDKRGRP
jgi:hypothetical protein